MDLLVPNGPMVILEEETDPKRDPGWDIWAGLIQDKGSKPGEEAAGSLDPEGPQGIQGWLLRGNHEDLFKPQDICRPRGKGGGQRTTTM